MDGGKEHHWLQVFSLAEFSPLPCFHVSFVCLTIYVAHSFLPASLSAGTRLAAVQLDRDLLWGPSRAVSSPVSQTLRVYTASIGEEAGDSGGRKG